MGGKGAKATKKSSVITFDDEGDLRLEVGGETRQTFVVCSRALTRVSRPFKAMLYGGFAETKSRKLDPDWTVELPEDDPAAFATILQIVHSKFQMVPDEVTRDELYHITILTDKYDMTEILRPWAKKWINDLEQYEIGVNPGDEVMLWISWELGHQELFTETARWLLEDSHLDEQSKLCSPHGLRMQDNVRIASLDVLGTWFADLILLASTRRFGPLGACLCKASGGRGLQLTGCRANCKSTRRGDHSDVYSHAKNHRLLCRAIQWGSTLPRRTAR